MFTRNITTKVCMHVPFFFELLITRRIKSESLLQKTTECWRACGRQATTFGTDTISESTNEIFIEPSCELGLYQFFLAFKAEFGNLAARSGPSIFSTVTNFTLKYRPAAAHQRERDGKDRGLQTGHTEEKRRVGIFNCWF